MLHEQLVNHDNAREVFLLNLSTLFFLEDVFALLHKGTMTACDSSKHAETRKHITKTIIICFIFTKVSH